MIDEKEIERAFKKFKDSNDFISIEQTFKAGAKWASERLREKICPLCGLRRTYPGDKCLKCANSQAFNALTRSV